MRDISNVGRRFIQLHNQGTQLDSNHLPAAPVAALSFSTLLSLSLTSRFSAALAHTAANDVNRSLKRTCTCIRASHALVVSYNSLRLALVPIPQPPHVATVLLFPAV